MIDPPAEPGEQPPHPTGVLGARRQQQNARAKADKAGSFGFDKAQGTHDRLRQTSGHSTQAVARRHGRIMDKSRPNPPGQSGIVSGS
jgi:hypothetical protein